MELLPKLSKESLSVLKDQKNLLAFSAGVDSTALFFTLLEYKIDFDIAFVNYQTREESFLEEEYAKELALKYDKKAFIKRVKLPSCNFEQNARVERYNFFKEIIEKENYQNLLTAHQLNDKLEWFFMQLSKGAGVVELLGFDEIRERDRYTLIRPLINYAKEELELFLKKNGIKYFIDKTNFDEKFKRNFIRKNFATPFLKLYKNGVLRSFEYLQKDKDRIYKPILLCKEKELFIFKRKKDDIENIRIIDESVKKLGTLLSKKQKDEILRQKDTVISHKIAISLKGDKIFISPFVKVKMPKSFKEKCRILKIPPKIRGYLYKEIKDLKCLEKLLC